MIPSVLGIKTALIAGAVALVVGFGAGVKVRGAFCDAAAGKAQARHDKRQLDAHDAATSADAALVPVQETELSKLESQAHEVRNQIARRECLGVDDVDRLRSLWPGAGQR